MAKESSFDIVSKVELPEVLNADPNRTERNQHTL